MIRIALCDDQLEMTSLVESLIIKAAKHKSMDVDIDVFFDGSMLVNNMVSGDSYDLIFLDIEMKILNGVETARKIREIDKDVILVYVSGHDSYWKDLFEVEPFRFVSKPINKVEFTEIFDKACERIKGMQIYFEFKYNREIIKVKFNDITYFESSKRTIYIYTSKGNNYKFYGKLNDVEENLRIKNFSFLRIHQSNLVNYKYIERIGTEYVVLADNTELLISGERQKEVRKKYCDLIGGELID